MTRYERHLFVCTNDRGPDHPKGCCARKGSAALADALKAAAHARGLKGRMRVNKAGCLDTCALGPSVVVYPEGIWYGRVQVSDAEEIVERTLLRGEVIERLLMPRPS